MPHPNRISLLFLVIYVFIPLILASPAEPQSTNSSAEAFQPTRRLSFHVPEGNPVATNMDKTVHYRLDTEGAEEWRKILPSGGHLIHIIDESGVQPYTVALFHQFKCLDIVRQQLMSPSPSSPLPVLVTHCMNYLRQSILCRLNLRLESAKNEQGFASLGYNAVCKDWTLLYAEAERNFRGFKEAFSMDKT